MKNNQITQTGAGNIAFTDITGSEFNIFIGKSFQYQELIDQLKSQEKLLFRTPEDEKEERLEISQKVRKLKQLIDQFKADVLQLAQEFNRAEINNERLRRARAFFDKGEFNKARAVLETELDQMKDEQTRLLVKRDEYNAAILPKLKSNAEQFFILGLLSQLNYANSDWFENSCRYFEDSIKSHATKENVFYYAVFSWRHNKVAEAEIYYKKYLTDFASEISLAERAGALNNMGLLDWDSNEFAKGLDECEEALKIYKKLSRDNPSAHFYEIAGTLTTWLCYIAS